MSIATFREKLSQGSPLAGTFMKTPAYQLIELFAQSSLDFVCIDAEHAPFDRAAMDACLAVSRALDFPVLVRVGDGSPREILWALDCGAVGLVVPHVDSVEKAQAVAKAARYGKGGRGYAGSSRWAGYATQAMPDLLARSASETVVFVQIEEPEAVEVVEQIAAVEGVDGLFLGPADLSVGYGHDHQTSDDLHNAMLRVGEAARANDIAYVSFVANVDKAQEWITAYGITVFFVASEQNWVRDTANTIASGIHGLKA